MKKQSKKADIRHAKISVTRHKKSTAQNFATHHEALCPSCERPFISKVFYQCYCSKRCQQFAYRKRKSKLEKLWKPRVKNHPPWIGRCEVCGDDLFSWHSTKKYCNAACKQAAYRFRRDGGVVYDASELFKVEVR